MKQNHKKKASLNPIPSLPGLLQHQLHLAKEYLWRLTQVDSGEASRGSATSLERAAQLNAPAGSEEAR